MKRQIIAIGLMCLMLGGCSNSKEKYDTAQSLAANGNYQEAIDTLQEIPKYKDSSSLIDQYNKQINDEKILVEAQELYDKKYYDESLKLLEENELKGELFEKICAERVEYYAQSEAYDNAISYLKRLPESEEIKNQISEYSTAKIYDSAVKAMSSGNLENAISIFQGLPSEFKDTKKFIELCKENIVYIGEWQAADRSKYYRDGRYLTEGVGDTINLQVSINRFGEISYKANGIFAKENNGILKWNYDGYTYEMSLTNADVGKYKTDDPGFLITTELQKPTTYAKYAYSEEKTSSQNAALEMAKDYLAALNFSKSALIEQLEYEGYSEEDANYAADNVSVDWDEQAYETAQNYLKLFTFDAWDLEEQLMHDGYTEVQARNAVEKCGLR